jgi:pimeloyl-ACP methyl ester carboxylesterase
MYTQVRADDVSLIIDQLETLCGSFYDRVDPSRILVYGHSLGGATAVNAAYLDERVLGGINFDGTVFGPVAEPGTDKPVLLVGPPIPENSTTTPSEAFMENLRGPKMLLTIDGTLHLSYFDVPLLLTYREDEIPPEVAPVIDMVLGTIDGNELVEVMNAILKAMIAFLFNDDVEGLCRISKDFPEILEVVEKDLNGCSQCDGTSF